MSDPNTDTSKMAEYVLKRLGTPSIGDTLLVNAAIRLAYPGLRVELFEHMVSNIPGLTREQHVRVEDVLSTLKEFKAV